MMRFLIICLVLCFCPLNVYGQDAKTAAVKQASIDGFRSAKFGMSVAQVEKACKTDLKVSAGAITTRQNPVEKTLVMKVSAKDIVEASGSADVYYTFGYRSQTLMQVAAHWKASNRKELQKLVTLANNFRNYFLASAFDPKTLVQNAAVNPREMIVFRGSDAKGRMVLVMLQTSKSKKSMKGNLHLVYMENPTKPDVFKIKAGQL